MIVDGRAIARAIEAEVAKTLRERGGEPPRLAIITCSPNFETQKYLALKRRRAAAAGIELTIVDLPEESTTETLIDAVVAATGYAAGVVVQLPLPAHIDREAVLAAVPVTHDPDGFLYGNDELACLPPVVVAVLAIAEAHNFSFAGKRVVVLGQGRLVGAPMTVYLHSQGIEPVIITERSMHVAEALREAEVIISGVGKPSLITPEAVSEGVAVFDAGTSEEGGVLVGDVHPEVANKASLFTPVPGGIGPITVAALLKNVMLLAARQ